jgi:Winged helix DNA-binding domain
VTQAEEIVVAERLVGREQVLAFRASAQSLDRRRPATGLAEVAGACGIQDTPPGNADVSLAARLDVDGPVVKEAVASKELVLAWSVRGAPYVFPPEDFAVFTLGARPAGGTLETLWGQPERALVEVEKAMVAAVGSEPSPKADVSGAVTAVLPVELTPWCRGCKVNHPSESVFRATPLLGRLVLTSTSPVLLTRAKTWLGADAEGDLDVLRTELLRRYLHCYGPTTPGHFAEWAGITKPDAKARWAAVADTLVPVKGARKGYLLAEDLAALEEPTVAHGVRLLPAKDAFLQARDRDLLFPDPAHRKAVYPTLGGPGVLLHKALPVGTWRGAAKGKRYQLRVDAFSTLTKAVWADIEAEAERVAHVRGHEAAEVVEAEGG